MKRPLPYILIFMLAGICFVLCHNEIAYKTLYILSAVALVFVIRLLSNVKKSLLLIPVFILGILIGCFNILPSDSTICKLSQENNENTFQCEVIDLNNEYTDSFRYIVKIQNINNKPVSSRAILYSPLYLKAGDNISFRGNINTIAQKANATDFDSYSYYRSINVEYRLYADNINVTGHSININSIAKAVRNSMSKNFNLIMPSREAEFMQAVVLGDKSNLDTDFYNIFKEGGVAHIIAISGLHISILAGMIFSLIKKHSKNLSFICVFLFLIFYCFMTGFSSSVVRASVMMGILMSGKFFGYDYDIISSTALACIILLAINPYYIFNIGFQYSFMCVFGIGMLSDVITKYKINSKKFYYIIVPVLVSCIACMFSKPITVYNFYYFNTWDILSNIIIVPFMEIVLIFGIIANFLTYISPFIGNIIIATPQFLIGFFVNVCNIIAKLPYYKINCGGITLYTLCSIYILYFTVYHSFMNLRNMVYILIPFGLFALIYTYPQSKLALIDTQYIQNTIETDNNTAILINCGSKNKADYGTYRILNYLKYRNINSIDCIYVTQTDYNHIGGFFEIYDKIKIRRICIFKNCNKNSTYERIINIANENNIEIIHQD